MNIKPTGDKFLIKYINQEIKTKTGLIIPEVITEKTNQGIVISINKNNKFIKSEIKIGDKVLFNKYSGQNIKIKNEELILIRENDILAIII